MREGFIFKENMSFDNSNILLQLLHLPEKIVSMSSVNNIVDLVLYHLASKECFAFKKSAYILNNPEFGCAKGVCGYDSQDEIFDSCYWQSPKESIEKLKENKFNQKIKSWKYNDKCLKDEEEIKKMALSELGFENPYVITWNNKYDNQGILIFEPISLDFLDKHQNVLNKIGSLIGMIH